MITVTMERTLTPEPYNSVKFGVTIDSSELLDAENLTHQQQMNKLKYIAYVQVLQFEMMNYKIGQGEYDDKLAAAKARWLTPNSKEEAHDG